MALRNGLLIHGPTHWAAAVRAGDGTIEVASEREAGARAEAGGPPPGPARAAQTRRGARRPAAGPPPAARRAAAVRGPPRDRGDRRDADRHRGCCAAGSPHRACARRSSRRSASLPALVALSDRNLAAYHGVEHKAIAAYEQGLDDPATVPKEHDRCGSNLIAPMMILSVGGTVLLERLVESPGPLARAGVGLGGASLAVEMFAWSDRNHGAPLAEAFHAPGREIQRLIATKEPTAEQLEVGVAALAEILRVEGA